jgi:Arc/MetJ-type ribon-helix-helix transcriptional regulator
MSNDQTATSKSYEDKLRAAKISISMPEAMVDFIDEQCRAFRVGRSTYLQMLLEAEQHSPRKEFTKRALD